MDHTRDWVASETESVFDFFGAPTNHTAEDWYESLTNLPFAINNLQKQFFKFLDGVLADDLKRLHRPLFMHGSRVAVRPRPHHSAKKFVTRIIARPNGSQLVCAFVPIVRPVTTR